MRSKKKEKKSHRSVEAHSLQDPLFRQRKMPPKDTSKIKHKKQYYEGLKDV